ncbi:MAG: TerC family protein [Sphingobacteriia bacterium]|jgi:predicted tellurium resistance membrane protein TerC
MEQLISLFSQAETWISFASLFAMLIVLDIDNVIFIGVLTTKLPPGQQERARNYGLLIGAVMRAGLLLGVDLLIRNQAPLFTVLGAELSLKDLIMVGGGLFLLTNTTLEIHNKLEGPKGPAPRRIKMQLGGVLVQLSVLNLVFSFDSVITAVGMAKHAAVMVLAILCSMLLVFQFAGSVGRYVQRHPTMKMLALSFLLLIGMLLIVEGIHLEVPKGYIYFAMAFSLFVEVLNLNVRRRNQYRDGQLAASTLTTPPREGDIPNG